MRYAFLVLVIWAGSAITAQNDTSFTTMEGMGQLNFSQAAYSNWAQGGENTLAVTANANLHLIKVDTAYDWTTDLNLSYGKIKVGADMRKSDDEIVLNTKYTRMLSDHWGIGLNGNFKSQFDLGYQYPNDSVVISKFLSPAYTSVSVGINYMPADYLTIYLSPAALKWTLVNDTSTVDQENYGVDANRKSRYEVGGLFKADFNKELAENVSISSTLELFSNYFNNPQNIDINWLNKVNMKVNDYITASLTLHIIYDDDILIPKENEEGEIYLGKGTQLREILSIGLSYKF